MILNREIKIKTYHDFRARLAAHRGVHDRFHHLQQGRVLGHVGRELSEELVSFHRLRQVLREQNNFSVEFLVTFVVLVSALELQDF